MGQDAMAWVDRSVNPRVKRFAHPSERSQQGLDLGGDAVNRIHAVHCLQLALGIIVAGQRGGLFVVLAKPLVEHLRRVILAHRLAGSSGILRPLDDAADERRSDQLLAGNEIRLMDSGGRSEM